MMLELDGQLDLMISVDGDRDEVKLAFYDTDARVTAFRATITRGDFVRALGRRGHLPCRMEVNDSGLVGMQQEIKREDVYVPKGPWEARRKRAVNAIENHEVDGWRGQIDDATNTDKIAKREEGGNWYTVLFRRHVPKETP